MDRGFTYSFVFTVSTDCVDHVTACLIFLAAVTCLIFLAAVTCLMLAKWPVLHLQDCCIEIL